MADNLIPGNSLTRAAERVRRQRETQRTTGVAEPITINAAVPTTTTRMRARLNVEPDDNALQSLIGQALTALSRGIRWARGSIINLVV